MQAYPDRMRKYMRMPHTEPGQRIGLFGGSFNPPHEGHLHVSEKASRRLELDQIWWMVTPGNPLKDHGILAPLENRLALCEELARHPNMKITAFEANLPTSYTANTLKYVTSRNPGVNFVWVMGADNLGQFHRWERWRDIASLMPIAVIDRPGATMSLHSAKSAIALRRHRVDENDAPALAMMRPPAWTFLHGPRNSLSSTALRERKALSS